MKTRVKRGRKYWEITKFTIKTQTVFKANFFYSLMAFTVHVVVFSWFWDFILKDKTILYTKQQLIWYIIVGELILYSVQTSYKRISEMVKNGDIANLFIRPINFVLYLFSEELSFFVKLGINMIVAIVLGLLLAGPLSVTISQLLLFSISFIISLLIGIFLQIIIGLSAFVIEENKSIHMILQKLQLVVTMMPVEMFYLVSPLGFYFFMCLPTTYLIYAPAKILVQYTGHVVVILLGLQIVSFMLVCGVIVILYHKGVKKINVYGG